MCYLRINATLQQFDEFLDYYGITEGDGMYLAPEDRVAICCISTGVFHFPNKRASEIAVHTVKEWLEEHPGKADRVIFNVFKDEDRR